jgi:hypothetical protein
LRQERIQGVPVADLERQFVAYGSCRLLVFFSTSSRTKPNALRTSRPGVVMCFTSAAANGLFLLSPSAAVDPALAA